MNPRPHPADVLGVRPLYLLGIAAVVVVPVLVCVHRRTAWLHAHRVVGCAGAGESALAGDQATLDYAISMYRDEHGQYPALDMFVQQMTMYTNADGEASPSPDFVHNLGPYIRSIPPMPKGPQRGCTMVAGTHAPSVGWIYDEYTGRIRPDVGLGP